MNGREFWMLRDVSNDELEASLGRLLGAGARLEARVVAHLAEVEARRLHLLIGCSSLYDYCRKRLSLSDYEAFVRIAAARVARKYPVVFGMLDRRELHLTAVCEVRDFLTSENHQALLDEISGKTKLQIREILRSRFPLADIPASLQKLPAFEPLAPGRYRLQLTLSAEQKEKLERARDLLSHANPSGDFAVVVERALDALLARLEQRRFGGTRALPARREPRTGEASAREMNASELHAFETPTPNAQTSEPRANETPTPEAQASEPRANETPTRATRNGGLRGSDTRAGETKQRQHISHAARRQVVTRDGARCAFIGDDGQRCEARAFLQFHHRQPWARGGHDGAENLELLCHAHNRLRAEQDFGRARVEQASSRAQRAVTPRRR
jgi:hypothetical protein